MKRTRIRSLAPSESPPSGTPRRYEDPRGYVRLRWKLGPGEYVETYERDTTGALVRTKPAVAKRIDWEQAITLYESGLSLPQVAAQLDCTSGQLSRGLRARGIAMRSKRDYEDGFDPKLVLRLYREGRSVTDAARLAGTTYPRAAEVVKNAGLMRRTGRPRGKVRASYENELRRQRPAVLERAGNRCEAGIRDVCVGRVDHIHHRRLRRQGGTNELSNLLAVCAACHHSIHARPAWSYDKGYLTRRTA